MNKLSMIVARDLNGAIGKNNELLWHIPEDLQYFKKNTLGKTIVMGRNTYDSIGRPLPGRKSVVMTRDPSFNIEGVDIVNSVDEVLALLNGDEEVIIIGGDSIYKQFMEHADILYITEVDYEFEGDTFFPELTDEWKLTSSKASEYEGPKIFNYCFNKYEKQE